MIHDWQMLAGNPYQLLKLGEPTAAVHYHRLGGSNRQHFFLTVLAVFEKSMVKRPTCNVSREGPFPGLYSANNLSPNPHAEKGKRSSISCRFS